MRAIDDLIIREGGYVNHLGDKGGPTKYGITESVARAHGYNGNMQDLPRDIAERIYLETYYIKTGIARVRHPALAEELLDSAVLHGPSRAISWLQQALNALEDAGLLTDGELGPKTLAALDAYMTKRRDGGELVLVRALNCLQGAYVGAGSIRAPVPVRVASASGGVVSRTTKRPYRGSKAVDSSCRSSGSCPHCRANRAHKDKRREPAA